MRPIEKGAHVRRVSGGYRLGLTGTLKRAPGAVSARSTLSPGLVQAQDSCEWGPSPLTGLSRRATLGTCGPGQYGSGTEFDEGGRGPDVGGIR